MKRKYIDSLIEESEVVFLFKRSNAVLHFARSLMQLYLHSL
jgi:hypothetical protein